MAGSHSLSLLFSALPLKEIAMSAVQAIRFFLVSELFAEKERDIRCGAFFEELQASDF